jgi:hypothetical protein
MMYINKARIHCVGSRVKSAPIFIVDEKKSLDYNGVTAFC